MIVVGIFGGLASQMNQYSFLRLLQHRFPNTEVKMAIGADWRRYMEHNGYELERVFGIKRNAVEWDAFRKLADFYPGYGIRAKAYNAIFRLRKILGRKSKQITLSASPQPDWSVLDIDPRKDVLFWSNYPMAFFDEIADSLRSEFAFKPRLTRANAELMSEILSTNSVSIHVRRGDYIKYGYPILGIDYYRNAMQKITAKVDNPNFFIFSDDPEWATNNLTFIPRGKFVHGNSGINSWADLQLMSSCKHNILANSGYSLFAEWLNTNPGKITIKPHVWPLE